MTKRELAEALGLDEDSGLSKPELQKMYDRTFAEFRVKSGKEDLAVSTAKIHGKRLGDCDQKELEHLHQLGYKYVIRGGA